MFKFKALAMMLVTATVGTAGAAESTGSEFFYQTPANTSAVTAHVGYQNFTFRNQNATGDATLSGLHRLGAAYEYGINEMLSIGADLSYSNKETDTNPKFKASGLEDPFIFLKGTSVLDFGRLRYGATLGLGFENAKDTQDGSVASGGYSLTPYIGADMDLGPGLLGARLSYAFLFERTVEEAAGGESKRTGGSTLSLAAFYEYMLADMVLGGALEFRSVEEVTNKFNGAETKTPGFSPFGIDLYARIPVAGFDLIPSLKYDFTAGGDRFDKYNDVIINVAGRVQF